MKWGLIAVMFIASIFDVDAKYDIDKWQATNSTIGYIGNTITLKAKGGESYSWCSVSPHALGLQLDRATNIVAEVKNSGSASVDVLFWAVGSQGWNSVAGSATIAQGESALIVCNLREQFKDGTPMLDPNKISHLEFMITKPKDGAQITIVDIKTEGEVERFKADENRLLLPEVCDEKPSAGKRVRYRISPNTDIYGVLYLPSDWEKDKSYPMIVEFPGNIFYTENCYSTGYPEQCTIGYGVSKGEGVILLSLPFVDYKKGMIATSGWGSPDDTVDNTIKMVESICDNFGVDSDKIMLTGFSRGAIACGFIGLRNSRIASLWKAIHCCQHYDGDGWGKATYEDAMLRLQNGVDIPQFHTDNNKAQLKELLFKSNINATYVNSNLGAHACDMFLDDRESTQQLRKWFWETIGN